MERRENARLYALRVVALIAATAIGTALAAEPARGADDSADPKASLVYVDWTDKHFGQIVVHDTETGQRRRLTSGADERQVPRWSPRGDRIIFLNTPEDQARPDLVVIDADGGHARRLLAGEDYVIDDMAWGPDGRRIVLTMRPNDDKSRTDLYVLSPRSGELTPLNVRIPQRILRGVDWSRDGTIAVQGVADDDSPLGSALFVVRPDGSGLQQVTTPGTGVFDNTPQWSPEGGRLLFNRGNEDRRCAENLMVLTVSSGDLHRVPAGCSGYSASWWPDGAHVLYNDEGTSLFSIALDGPDPFLVARHAFMASWRPGSSPALPDTGA